MKAKKNEKLNLEKKRPVFFWIGMIISLVLVITAFEWRSKYDTRIMKNIEVVSPFDDWTAPVKDEIKPPKPKKVVVAPIIEEVKDDEKVDEDIKIIIDTEDISDDELDSLVGEMKDESDDEVYFPGVIESNPLPIGGMSAFYKFVGENVKYPPQAQRLGIEGKVFIGFVLDKQGKLTELKIIRGIGGGCDEEALRVLSKAPAWTPGKQRGKPVKVRMVLPVTFKLK